MVGGGGRCGGSLHQGSDNWLWQEHLANKRVERAFALQKCVNIIN